MIVNGIVEGNRNPELFLPTELFHRLVLLAFVTQPKFYPLNIAEYSHDLFRRPAELQRLATITLAYSQTLRRELATGDEEAIFRLSA